MEKAAFWGNKTHTTRRVQKKTEICYKDFIAHLAAF